jgi:hypothetical protein
MKEAALADAMNFLGSFWGKIFFASDSFAS